jgi:hypothetical protein
MKKILLLVLFGLFLSMQSYAQYNYQNGLLPVNGIMLKVYKDATEITTRNIANVLEATPITHSTIACDEADFGQAGFATIRQVYSQVFSASRKLAFAQKPYLYTTIYADAIGKIKEVTFLFPIGSPILPEELYQIETQLKALPPLGYVFPTIQQCQGVNYRLTSFTVYVNEL